MPPTPHKDTAVVDTPWDGPAAEANLSNDAGRATYEQAYAWRDPNVDEDSKSAYKLPHHEVDSDGKVGAANVNGVRNGLSRLPQTTGIPDADKTTIEGNLNKHLDKYNADQEGSHAPADPALVAAFRVQTDCRVWAIDPRTLAALAELDGQLIAAEVQRAAAEARRARGARNTGGIATVPLKGVLIPAADDFLAMLFGIGGGLEAFRTELDEAAGDPNVEAIVIDVDSPGGLVDFIPETAAQVRAARAHKPIVAVADTMAASAAYWIASQADELVVTPSGEVGSIGCYELHRDLSAAHAMKGIVPTLVSAGKFKVEGNPYEPLGDEARAAMQADVDDYYRMFTADVARGRSATRDEVTAGYGEGRCLHAKQAVSAGLADRVETLGDAVRRVASPAGRAALDRRRAEVRELELVPLPVDATYTPDERNRLLAVLA